MIGSRFITAIMACDEQGAIGLNSGLPNWNCPEDMQHFRDTTRHQLLIMGRATYQSMPQQAFHERQAIVVSAENFENAGNIVYVPALETLPKILEKTAPEKKVFLIGGRKLVETLFKENCIDKFILSEISGHYPNDCAFSPWFLTSLKQWKKTSSDPKNGFVINTYINPFLKGMPC